MLILTIKWAFISFRRSAAIATWPVSRRSCRTCRVICVWGATHRACAASTAGCSTRSGLTGEARAALRAAHQLIFLARMTLGQATEILELHDHLTPEVVELMNSWNPSTLARWDGPAKAGEVRDRNRDWSLGTHRLSTSYFRRRCCAGAEPGDSQREHHDDDRLGHRGHRRRGMTSPGSYVTVKVTFPSCRPL